MKKLFAVITVLITLTTKAQLIDMYPAFRYTGTGGLGIHSGTTAQRYTGDIRWLRWNSDSGRIEIKINSTTWRGILFNGEGGGGSGSVPASGIVTSNGTAFSSTTLSSGIASQITDETGTGALTFATTPTFTTKITTPRIFGGTSTTDSLVIAATSGNATTGADIYFRGGNNAATELIRITASGNVGINTFSAGSPSQKLHVGGSIMGSGNFLSSSGQMDLGINGAVSNALRITTGALFSQSSNILLQGILSGATGYTVLESAGNSIGLGLSAFGTNPILFFPNRTEAARFNGSGEFQIGSASDQGAFTLQNTGGFYQSGNVKINLGSDATGDTYYRNSSGLLNRVAIGSSEKVCVSDGSGPTWQTLMLKGTTTWDPASIGANSSTTTTITVTGAALGDVATVSKTSGSYSNGEWYDAFVSAADTVTIRLQNVSGGTFDIASATFHVIVHKYTVFP